MGLSGIGASGYQAYGAYDTIAQGSYQSNPVQQTTPLLKSEENMSESELRAAKRAGTVECQSCKNRKYQDGSDEGDVSFKAPGHISPQASAATVSAHESQHVTNAFQKAGEKKGQVLSATVSLKSAICPECGRSYIAGGQTNTTIRYDKSTPYGDSKKASDAANGAIGGNIDVAV